MPFMSGWALSIFAARSANWSEVGCSGMVRTFAASSRTCSASAPPVDRHLPEDQAESIRLLLTGAVRADDIVTSTYLLDDVAVAFACSGGADDIKVLVLGDPETFAGNRYPGRTPLNRPRGAAVSWPGPPAGGR